MSRVGTFNADSNAIIGVIIYLFILP